MYVLATTCAGCNGNVAVPLNALLVAVVPDQERPGRLTYLCRSCDNLVEESVSSATVSMLVAAGCTPIHVHPEASQQEETP